MSKLYFRPLLISTVLALCAFLKPSIKDDQFISYELNPRENTFRLYWKDDAQIPFKSIQNLKNSIESKGETLLFAMNAGMYKTDNSPLGLFIQDFKVLNPINNKTGSGNFYLKPNGIFYITKDNIAGISKTEDFPIKQKIQYATQSGPLLLINGKIHPAFTKGSTNLNIRNGVGILPNNKVIFAMSKTEVNFYDFAEYFKNLGCKNALYLDGFVCRTYLPQENWIQTDGNFGVIIGVTKGHK